MLADNELFAGAGASAISGYRDYYAEVELGVDLADAFQRVDTKSFSDGSDAFEFGDAFLHELLETQTTGKQQQDSTADGNQLRRADAAAPVEYSDNQDRESSELLLELGDAVLEHLLSIFAQHESSEPPEQGKSNDCLHARTNQDDDDGDEEQAQPTSSSDAVILHHTFEQLRLVPT